MEKKVIRGANPYMPLWEHVPDGEPRVFEYRGEKRVYVYGSHDTERTRYCGRDYVVWSAPVTDLTDWKCHGTCYRGEEDNDVLTAIFMKFWEHGVHNMTVSGVIPETGEDATNEIT